MYKVLDVREIVTFWGGSVHSGVYGVSGSVDVNSRQYVVVIAEDEDNNRKRFEFCASYKKEFLGEDCYYGHRGEYDILVPGDKFIIEKTSTWPVVKLVKEGNEE